ncbi:hypothetical protein [Halobacillus mangrovi]|uniref:hypothetical protein n=1 Tax=Halobacillus mangrovi TaxID=402384 RepID=UPI003D9711DA
MNENTLFMDKGCEKCNLMSIREEEEEKMIDFRLLYSFEKGESKGGKRKWLTKPQKIRRP